MARAMAGDMPWICMPTNAASPERAGEAAAKTDTAAMATMAKHDRNRMPLRAPRA